MIKKSMSLRVCSSVLLINLLYLTGSFFLLKENPHVLVQVCMKAAATTISLALVSWYITKKRNWRILYFVLIFALAGDILLAGLSLFQHRDLVFQLGAASFFLCYILFGIALIIRSADKIRWRWTIPVAAILTLIGIFQYLTLHRLDVSMRFLVICYIGMTIVLLFGAICYLKAHKGDGFWFFFAASMFFISDSIIGQKEFGHFTMKWIEIPIMLTYGLGHGGLILGSRNLRER